MKDVVVIGGPNGAGKSTLANQIVPEALQISHFINADEIARELAPASSIADLSRRCAVEINRGCGALTDLTSQQLIEIVLRGLEDAARDVDARRVPLDGRVRILTPTKGEDQRRVGTHASMSAK